MRCIGVISHAVDSKLTDSRSKLVLFFSRSSNCFRDIIVRSATSSRFKCNHCRCALNVIAKVRLIILP
jgi:formyltetrahydrofolate hydrolase